MLGWVAGKAPWPRGWARAPPDLSTTLQRRREPRVQAKEPVVGDPELSQNCLDVARLGMERETWRRKPR